MEPFRRNPLFTNASAATRRAAQDAFGRTTVGKLLAAAESTYGDVRRGPARLGEILKSPRFAGFNPQQAAKEMLNTDMGRLAREVERYSRSGGWRRELFGAVLDALGPSGKILKAMLGPVRKSKGIERDLEAARRLLQTFGYEVLDAKPTASPRTQRRGKSAAKQFLENMGYTVLPPDTPDPDEARGGALPFGISPNTSAGKPRRAVKLDIDGQHSQFPVHHPIVTGEMIPARMSTNVHSYGYDIETRVLYIRFMQDRGNPNETAKGPGSLYRYSHVPPAIFLNLYNSASVGVAIWDYIRIRGTVSGHRYDYQLVGITQDYVPRKATYVGKGQEYFVKRTIALPDGRVISSERPEGPVGFGGAGGDNEYGGGPNRGAPNRGGPNRGSPNRGR